MSARRAAPDVRCMWWTPDDAAEMQAIMRALRQRGYTTYAKSVQLHLDAYSAAPADPAEAVRRECWTSLDGFVSPNHSQMVADAVLRALGLPAGLPHTTPTGNTT